MNPHIRTITDAIMMILLLVLAALLVHHDRQLQQSRSRENEMFVLANRLDAALADQEEAATRWRHGALSCLARAREYRHLFDATTNPLISPEQVSTWRPLDAPAAAR